MKKILYNIRQQPEEVRRHILHVVTVVFGVILLFLWVYSLGKTFSSDNRTQASKDLQPFSALKANLIDGYNSI